MAQRWRNDNNKIAVLESLLNCSTAIVFDTETSGLNSDVDRIIEIAATKLSLPDFKTIDKLHLYIRPAFLISEKITEITGITNEMLRSHEYEEDLFVQICEFFQEEPEVLVAHNAPFDIRFLTAMYSRNNKELKPTYVLDTLEMAKDLIPKEKTKDYKLGTLAELYGLTEGIQFHSAMDDTHVCSLLFQIFAKDYSEIAAKQSDTTSNLRKPRIFSIGYWEGFRGLCRAYVHTDFGALFYDIRYKSWGSKDANIDIIDMSYLESKCLELTNTENLSEFARKIKIEGKIKF